MRIIRNVLVIKWTWYMRNVTGIFMGESEGVIAQTFAGLPFIIVKEWKYATDKTINHEKIHIRQALELLYVGFALLYVGNYLWNLIKGTGLVGAYDNIIFEREAYDNEDNLEYLKTRRMWTWINYWKKKKNGK